VVIGEGWLPDFVANQRLLLAWPYRGDVWRSHAKPAQNALLRLLDQLPASAPVSLVVSSQVKGNLPDSLKRIHRIEVDYDDIWLRDIAPLWLNNGKEVKALSFNFDGWSGVQQAITADKQFAENLCGYFNLSHDKAQLVAEGGAFTHNGKGDWIVGLACIKRRNPDLSHNELKAILSKLLPGQRLYFFNNSLSADETGGHIDNMAIFVDSDTLLYVFTDDVTHPDYEACQQLQKLVSQLPKFINAIPLPLPRLQSAMPEERQDIELNELSLKRTIDLPLLCSYVNVLQTDKLLVIPEFGLETDDEAFQRIQNALPERKVLSFNAREFVLGGGGLHCISHNLPASLKLTAG
jgi:agmatine deiminase|tara:strand:+ start:25828 stop:26877 length:1050 start_codon:yes stop_codon:yes gene_type:complete